MVTNSQPELSDAIAVIIDQTSHQRGHDYFSSMLNQLQQYSQADYVFIGRLDASVNEVETISLFKRGKLMENFRYSLTGTPCNIALAEGNCVYPNNICSYFPDDQLLIDMGIEGYIGTTLPDASNQPIGILVALYEKPVETVEFSESLFTFFSGQVATALINQDLMSNLEKLVEDRTEQYKAERNRAEMLAKQKSNFLANMSHEIRTPMNGVLGMCELLSGTQLDQEQQEYLGIIQSSGKNLLTIIDDILDFSKISQEKIRFDLISLCYRTWVDEIMLLYAQVNKDNLNLVSSVADDVPEYLMADTTRLHQLIANLLSNAIKFTSVGSVSFHTEVVKKSADKVRLKFSVVDTGIGIEKHSLGRIFNDFEQADDSTARHYGGTGLGLAICKKIVEQVGGKFWVESEPNKGSAFYIESDFFIGSQPQFGPKANEEKRDFSNLKILLAEDNKTNQLVAAGFLKRLGVKDIVFAEDGEQVQDVFFQSPDDFDIILMDCEMPVLDGYDAASSIRSWEQQRQRQPINICALTAHVTEDYIERAKLAGMDFHLSKPLQMQKLANYLQDIKG